jgi:hypothetical protein
LAAAIITLAESTNITTLKSRVVKFTFSDSYPTGGEALAPADFKLEYLAFVFAHPSSGYQFSFDYTANKILAYRLAAHTHTFFLNQADVVDGAGTRVNAATNLIGANSGSDISIAGVADTTGHGGVVQAAASALTEVSNTVDLSLVTTRVLAYGR